MDRKTPIGIELVKKGLITEEDITKALKYQKEHIDQKLVDIINELGLCDSNKLLEALGEILDEKTIMLSPEFLSVEPKEYISIDMIKQYKAIPFEITGNRIKIAFASTENSKSSESIRLILLNKGLIMEKYITFSINIQRIILSLETTTDVGKIEGKDTTGLVDNIIKNAIDKRASDIHIEPMEDELRVRFRIDGELLTVAKIPKESQSQVIGRLKAISNMFQEKQESQDGRITMYATHNIRVSSQKNIHGEKIVLRLLKKNDNIKGLQESGFFKDEQTIKKCFNKKNSITIVAAPTGEGKTTTLYSIIKYLNKPEINITTIEEPVEIRIEGLNQIEVNANTNFSGSLRTVLRQDPDIILVGEIRDQETAEICVQAGHTGHYVLSTIHTIDAIEAVTRLRKFGISNYDISSSVATCVSQRLLRKLCPNCRQERDFTSEEIETIENISNKYDMNFQLKGKKTYDAVGCKECNNIGYYDRSGMFEVLIFTEAIKELVANNASTIEIREAAIKEGYRPLAVDGIRQVIEGITTLNELNKKIILY